MENRNFDPTKEAWSLLEQFKKFAFKGNVVDLAVGVVIGTAFGKIVDSLVKSIIMPLLSVVLPANQGYQNWAWTIHGKSIPYGHFLAEVVNFLIVAAALFFFVVKFLGWLTRNRREEEASPTPPLTKDQMLLEQIRDLLKERVEAAPGEHP
ncbi:large conductance mechanosensitive channel protein MscL [Paludisphaera rhizosphaerae]|uniref:large conductance mechanosensitive channel protein MscL n=1 Tax=Paludisphaera rhizosphaerae TaxID=2711216 RepID=UPI0013EB0FEC|nr:large conductance mechanosensitive channel protein MscL [Paludisphaera rhizosphaerae]